MRVVAEERLDQAVRGWVGRSATISWNRRQSVAAMTRHASQTIRSGQIVQQRRAHGARHSSHSRSVACGGVVEAGLAEDLIDVQHERRHTGVLAASDAQEDVHGRHGGIIVLAAVRINTRRRSA